MDLSPVKNNAVQGEGRALLSGRQSITGKYAVTLAQAFFCEVQSMLTYALTPPQKKSPYQFLVPFRALHVQAWKRADSHGLIEWSLPELQHLYEKLKLLCRASKRAVRQGLYPTVHITSPVMVLGDLHGSFDDLNFFLKQLYDGSDSPETPNCEDSAGDAETASDFRIAANVLMVGPKGEHQVNTDAASRVHRIHPPKGNPLCLVNFMFQMGLPSRKQAERDQGPRGMDTEEESLAAGEG